MKTAVIYTSQTGFTKRYAQWLSDIVKGDVFDLKEVQKKDDSFFDAYDSIVYAGWVSTGKVVKANWFFEKAAKMQDKRLALVAVGAGECDDKFTLSAMDKLLTDEQSKYIRAFYCQGGLDYDKMSAPTRLVMKMFASSIKNKKNATEQEKSMGEMFSRSFDKSDVKQLEPVVKYLVGEEVNYA